MGLNLRPLGKRIEDVIATPTTSNPTISAIVSGGVRPQTVQPQVQRTIPVAIPSTSQIRLSTPQQIATAITAPVANYYANKESDRAKRLLSRLDVSLVAPKVNLAQRFRETFTPIDESALRSAQASQAAAAAKVQSLGNNAKGKFANPQVRQQFVQQNTVKAPTLKQTWAGAGDAFNRAGATVGMGAMRSGVGTAQAVSGLYDLATPGKGTNRFSQKLDRGAKTLDQTVKDQNLSSMGYRVTQGLTDLGTGLAAGGAAGWAAKAATASMAAKSPVIAKVVSGVGKADEFASQGINKATGGLVKGNVAQRVIGKTIRTAANPRGLISNAAANTFYAGQGASKGQKVDPKLLAAQTAAFQLGVPLAGSVIGEGAKVASNKLARGGVTKTVQTARTLGSIKDDAQWALHDAKATKALQNADAAPTAAQMNSYLAEARENIRLRNARFNELNPVNVGLGTRKVSDENGKAMSVDPLEALKQEARKYKSAEEFVNSQANLLHGTKADFTEFDPSLLGTNTGAPSAKKGFFFTDTPEIANTYANPGRNFGTAISKNLESAFKNIESAAKKEGLTNSLENNTGGAMIVGTWPKVTPGTPKEVVIKSVLDKMETLKQRFNSSQDIAKIDRFKQLAIEELNKTPITELELFGKVMKSKVDFKNPLIFDDAGFRNGASYAKRIDEAISKGHDGVIIKNTQDPLRGNIYVALDKNQIMTEKQLTDLYHQATAPVQNTGLEALKAEARKYKSADEFIKAIQDGKVSIPKGSPEQIAAIQKQLGMNWDEAYKTPTGVYDMQKKVANDLYNQAHQSAPVEKTTPADPLEALKAEARKYKSAEEFMQKSGLMAHDLPTMKFDYDQAKADFGKIKTLAEDSTVNMPDATPAQRKAYIKKTIEGVNKKYGTNLSTKLDDVLDVTRAADDELNNALFRSADNAYKDLYNQAHQSAPVEKTTSQYPEILGFRNTDTVTPIMSNGKVVGGVDATVDRLNPERLRVHTIRIVPSEQGGGLGSKTINKLFEDNPGINQITGNATAEARPFWVKQGAKFTDGSTAFTLDRPVSSAPVEKTDPIFGQDGKAWQVYNKRYSGLDMRTAKSQAEFDGVAKGDSRYFDKTPDAKRLQDIISGDKKVGYVDNASYDPLFAKKAKEAGLYTKEWNGVTVAGKNKADVERYTSVGRNLSKQEEYNLIGYKPEQFAHQSAPVEKTAQTAGVDPALNELVSSPTPEIPTSQKLTVTPKKNGTTQLIKKGMLDSDAVILDELRNIEKQTGQTGLVDKFMYNSNMQRGSNAGANVMLQTSENVKNAIGGLSKEDYQRFSEYANARTELSTAGKTTATSRPVDELRAIVKSASPEFQTRFDAMNAHYKELAQMAHDAGVISDKQFKEYTKSGDYIRIQRDMGDLLPGSSFGRGNGYSLGQTVLDQKRRGSTREVLPAGETLADYTQRVHREVSRNKTATNLIKNLESSGLARRLKNAQDAVNKNAVTIRENGTTVHYEVSPAMKEAIQNINPYHMNVVMQILAAPGRVMRAGVTGLNPVFIARNLLKDQASSAINSEHILATHNPASFFSGLWNATNGVLHENNDPLWQDFLKHYGDQTSYDLTRNVKDTRMVVNRIRGGKLEGIKQGIKSPIRGLENLASITEKSTRFQNYRGAYKQAIADGLSPAEASEKAAIQAWQNSVDFSRAGEWGRVINTVIPYWNPATQGVRQMGRTFVKHPIKSTLTATAIVGVPLATATAWNLSNPETAQIYNNIPEYEKDNNLIIIPPGTTQNQDGTYDVVKIPLPPGYKDAFMPIRRALEAYYNDKPVEGQKIAQDILQTVSGPVNVGSMGQFAGSFIPQAAKPLVQQYANQDLFSGQKIVPDYINNATDANGNPVAEDLKAYKNTSSTAKKIGSVLGVSPIRVEKFVKDTGGTVATNLLHATDKAVEKNIVGTATELAGGTGWKRSFGSAQGITNENASAGAKYFSLVQQVTTKDVPLNGNELAAYNSLHPSKTNFLGDQISDMNSVYNPAAQLDVYNRYPKVFEADKKINDEQAKNGGASNPLYSLEVWQVKKVLEKNNLPPGATDPELSNLYKQDWYQDYQAKRSQYYTQIQSNQQKELKAAQAKGDTTTAKSIQSSIDKFATSDNPYPTTSDALQKVMDYYTSLPSGTGARSAWIKANPSAWQMMQDQFAKIDTWQNNQRLKRGLDATEGAVGQANGYGTSSASSYGRSGSSGSANPYKYAVSINAGGTPKKVSLSSKKVALKGTKAYGGGTSKPKVGIKKSKV